MNNPTRDTRTYVPKGKKLGELRRRLKWPIVADAVREVNHPFHTTRLKELRFKVSHKLLFSKRKWLYYSFYHRLYPRTAFIRRFITVMLAFLLLGPTILLIFRPKDVSAAWYDDNYAHRQKFTFTHNADLTTPQRISFTLNTQNLVSNGVMQSDCDDTRITDLNGKVLKFKLTGTCNAGSTTYDVVFPTILNGTNIGYVYYGNPRAINASQEVSDATALTPSGGAPSVLNRQSEEAGPGPVAYLLFDEGYGSTTRDATGNGNNGGVRGATWRNKELCLSNNCLQFDGVDDSVIATNAASIDFDTGLATGAAFQAWIRPNTTGEAGVGQVFNKGANTYLRITNSNNGRADLQASLDLATSDATVTVTQGIDINKWTHITMAYTNDSDDEITVYVNGVRRGTSTDGDGAPASSDTSDILIGGGNGAHFKGFIDEFKVYPYERSNASVNGDVSAIGSSHGKSAAVGPDDSFLSDGLVGYWKMDDGVGNACPAGVDKACDSSGNGNTGTWRNGVASTSGKFGFATNYDGSDDYIALSSDSVFTSINDFTTAAWVKPDTISGYEG
jgi:hypothetical protein